MFLIAVISVNAHSNVFPTGARPAGMGNAFISQFNEFSMYHNQAGLAKVKHKSISLFFENRFMIKQMSERAGIFTLPTSHGNFAFQFNSFGQPAWAESNAGIAYALDLSKKLSGGVQLNYFGVRLPEANRTAMTASFEIGAIYQINEKTFFGIHLANPYAPSINTVVYTENIPWRFRIGGHTKFSNDFMISYEAEKMEQFRTVCKLGAQWEVANRFFIRGGINTSPSRFFTGFGYETNKLSFDFAFSYHQYLGYIPALSIIYSFK